MKKKTSSVVFGTRPVKPAKAAKKPKQAPMLKDLNDEYQDINSYKQELQRIQKRAEHDTSIVGQQFEVADNSKVEDYLHG